MLNSDYIYQQISIEIRPFFHIEMPKIPKEYAALLDNIAQAIMIINRFARLNKAITLFVGTFPLSVTLPHSRLAVEILEPALHISVENWIFLDLDQLFLVSPPLQRACVLEELAHSVMNIADEHLVKVMVAEMLPDVIYQNGQLCPL